MHRTEKCLLNEAGIIIPKGTPRQKTDLIEVGLQLMTLDKDDILKILDENTSINQAEMILRDGRIKGEIKHLITDKDKSVDMEDDLEME